MTKRNSRVEWILRRLLPRPRHSTIAWATTSDSGSSPYSRRISSRSPYLHNSRRLRDTQPAARSRLHHKGTHVHRFTMSAAVIPCVCTRHRRHGIGALDEHMSVVQHCARTRTLPGHSACPACQIWCSEGRSSCRAVQYTRRIYNFLRLFYRQQLGTWSKKCHKQNPLPKKPRAIPNISVTPRGRQSITHPHPHSQSVRVDK